MFKKTLSWILALIVISAPLLGGAGTVRAASVDDLEAAVEKQVRTFGDSIDQNKADDNAASALARHGISGGGKLLKVGKSHPLTATMFNSELLQTMLTTTCTKALQYMERFNLTSISLIRGSPNWYGSDSYYYSDVYTDDVIKYEYKDFRLDSNNPYHGKLNSYDNSLDWMVACAAISIKIEQTKRTGTEAVYSISCMVEDRFDFSTSSNSGFKNLISGFGAVLFREFDWESTASFQLKVPLDLLSDYGCSHAPAVYRWTYDSENKFMSNDVSGDYAENGVTRITYVPKNSDTISYYHKLDKLVRLYHNEPWVLEYDVKNPGTILLAPLSTASSSTHFSLMNRSRVNLWFRDHEYVTVSDSVVKEYGLSSAKKTAYHFYGTALNTLFTYNTKNIHTLRLENEIHADGSNMVYLTVYNKDTGELLLDKAPMDDYTRYESWTKEYELKSESDNWISGKDLYIQYIGNSTYRFSAKHFELRIWENGENGGAESYYKTKVTKPTCTAQGYTTYTCSHCGYSYQSDKVKATGHSFSDWTTFTEPTCTDVGSESRKCKTCGESESREIAATGHSYESVVTNPTCTEGGYTTFTCPCGDSYVGDETAALGHSFEDYVCTVCGEREYILGDVDLDETVDVDDVLALLWNVLFPEEYPIEAEADFDGNGTVDVDDVLALLWHVLFPEEYPLN